MASFGTPPMSDAQPTTSVVTLSLKDIPTSFGTPSSAFVSQFCQHPVVTPIMTETSPITAPGSSPLEATFSEITSVATPPVHGPLRYIIDTSLAEANQGSNRDTYRVTVSSGGPAQSSETPAPVSTQSLPC